METVKVTMTAKQAGELISKIEWPWELRLANANGGIHDFELWVDGSPSVHMLRLNPDSTWVMTSHVEV